MSTHKTYLESILTGFNRLKKTFKNGPLLNALGSKFDLDVKSINVNLEQSFEQIW